MAASHNLPQLPACGKSTISKSGVLTIHGFGVRVRMQSGHLEIEDGIGDERRRVRLARVGHGLRRLVCIAEDGFFTLDALKWLADQQASLIMLERSGRVSLVTGPTAPSDARLRRAQALARQSGVALEIMRELMRAKLNGQQQLVRSKLANAAAADVIARLQEHLSDADSLDTVAQIEAQAANAYWSAWSAIQVSFPRQDIGRVPDHWCTFGTRKSAITGSPRLATNPPNAILNYCYALLECEARLASAALGLDPGMGMLHVDTPKRDSLACDIMEAVRPSVDAWLLDWITREPFRRADFFEQRNGNCRLLRALTAKLSETSPIWGKLAAPWAEYVAHSLWASVRHAKSHPPVATRLTQQHRREAKGQPSFAKVETPKPNSLCRWCGNHIQRGKTYCVECAPLISRENFNSGRREAHHPEFLAKRADTMLQHRQSIREWKPSDLPAWLTRDAYVKQVMPRLTNVAKSLIRSALRVSEPYASFIKEGKRIPHARYWKALADLVGSTAG
jgi:CRISPR-associated endonuclease Cas1